MPRHRSSAVPLAWLYVALIVYASLYPFSGWRLPGHSPVAFLIAPWWRWWSVSDAVFNLLGYMPLGVLVFGACVRSGVPPLRAFGYAVAAGTGLALGMETLQNFLAKRIASNVDLGLNALGIGVTTLSIALNFGPDHALAWITPQVTQAVALGTAAGALLSLAPRRVAAALGLMALTALIMLVARAPADPYYAQSLQAWEQGRFIRFHGAAQWAGWIWPYAAIVYLLWRVAAREEG